MQYIVQSKNINDRRMFYNFLINNGYKPANNFKKQNFINNSFPFVIEQDNTFWICESVTCCAAASYCGAIINIDEYFAFIKKSKKKLVLNKKVRMHE